MLCLFWHLFDLPSTVLSSYFRVEADILNREREKLMKKLIEVEMDGQAAAKQVSDLRDHIRKLRSVSTHLVISLHLFTEEVISWLVVYVLYSLSKMEMGPQF